MNTDPEVVSLRMSTYIAHIHRKDNHCTNMLVKEGRNSNIDFVVPEF